ncbi:PIG-L family deacetylase [Embleya sp. NPDC059259]|uniref:PIG-L family deacetylase n=1 Tax=unclassified Embleya TaxID=2699296 RepID=UPI0036B5A978
MRSHVYRVIGSVGLALGLILGTTGPVSADPLAAPDGFMQIAAHPDDDLFFMNPELVEGIRAGAPSTTIYLTDGYQQDSPHVRQRGAMAAYAAMAEKWGSTWTGSSIAVADALAEVYTLDERDDIRLIFLNLRDGECLLPLQNGDVSDCVTSNPASPETGVDDRFTYHRDDIATAVYQLIREYRPASLRTMDALPDNRYRTGDALHDHPDHVASARYANEAVARYSASESARLFVTSYRGYNVEAGPNNLAADDLYNKRAAITAYTDIATGARGNDDWRDPAHERWSRGSDWVGRNADGTLQAFAVIGEKVVTWRQSTNGSWGSAQELPWPGGPLAPGLSVAPNYDGRLQLLGRRLDDHHIVTIHQTSVNGNFAASWSDFGNPNDYLGVVNRPQVGTPIMVRNADGLLQIFVKNGGGGVSTVYQSDPTNGWWDLDWKDIGGTGVQDGLSAVLNDVGHIELFAATLGAGSSREGRLATWYQTDSKGTFAHNPYLVADNVASAPSAIVGGSGQIRVFYRAADTGDVGVVTQLNVAGAWQQTTGNLGNTGGTRKPLVASGSDRRILLYTRNDESGITVNWQTGSASGSGFGGWQRIPATVIDSPAVVARADGRPAMFHIGTDGMLYFAHQDAGSPDAPFSAWSLIG